MKKILFLLLIISFGIAQAQDSEPSPWDFIWGFSNTPRVFDVDSFQQKSILTGFQWGGSWQMNNAILDNIDI